MRSRGSGSHGRTSGHRRSRLIVVLVFAAVVVASFVAARVLSAPATAVRPAAASGRPVTVAPSAPTRSPSASGQAPVPQRVKTSLSVTPAPSASSTAASAAQAQAGGTTAPDIQVLRVINAARTRAGLHPYTFLPGLMRSSAAHNALMAGGCGLSHQCPGESSLGTRISAQGVTWMAVGENIGDGGPEPATTTAVTQMAVQLTQSMLNEQPPDDGHRLNILSGSFRYIGITVVRDSGGTVWMTQDFSG